MASQSKLSNFSMRWWMAISILTQRTSRISLGLSSLLSPPSLTLRSTNYFNFLTPVYPPNPYDTYLNLTSTRRNIHVGDVACMQFSFSPLLIFMLRLGLQRLCWVASEARLDGVCEAQSRVPAGSSVQGAHLQWTGWRDPRCAALWESDAKTAMGRYVRLSERMNREF